MSGNYSGDMSKRSSQMSNLTGRGCDNMLALYLAPVDI